MNPDDYIAQYGAALSESEKRYIRAFGAPEVHTGPSRNPSTPGMTIRDENATEHRARMARLDKEAGDYMKGS